MTTSLLRMAMLVIFLISSMNLYCIKDNSKDGRNMNETKLSEVLEHFDRYSYYAGATFAAAEFVAAGCKKLALSSPYSEEELAVMLKPTKMAAQEYHLPIYVEKEFLTTPLFSTELTKDKTVILIAQNQQVLDEYFALKKLKQQAVDEGRLDELEREIAWKFGKLLSYSDEYIEKLLSEHKN